MDRLNSSVDNSKKKLSELNGTCEEITPQVVEWGRREREVKRNEL